MMIRTLTVLSLAALGLCACKPTERTALKKKQQQVAAETPAEVPAEAPAEPASQPEIPAEVVVTPPPAEPLPMPVPEVQQLEPARSIMVVRATLQEYNRLQPWEKETPRQARALGVYMGEGRVLTVGRAVRAAT